MKRSLVLSPLMMLVAAVVAAGPPSALAGPGAARTITVQGTGIVTSVPNEAEFDFGVTVNAATAKAALSGNARKMTALIEVIKRQGILAADIQTAEISLTPNTNDNGTKILNFTASNSVTVKTTAIAKAGTIVDAAVGAGANLVGGPTLTPSDQLALERRALAAAVGDARARALAVAVAAHVRLGAVITVTETSSTPVTFGAAPKISAAASSTPVEAGTVQTEEDVTVTFAIR